MLGASTNHSAASRSDHQSIDLCLGAQVAGIEHNALAAPGSPKAARSFKEENNRAATQILEKALARASELGVDVQTVHVANSAASTAILDKASELDCDLIVMASHGRSGLNKLLLGSQTNVVVKTSPVPVLVVR